MQARMSARSQSPVNLLELRPQRKVRWEIGEDGRIVLYVPRLHHRWLRSWLEPMLARPEFRVRLDALGTSFWKNCDGATPVAEIARRMAGEFGCDTESLWERISHFVARLEREELLGLTAADEDASHSGET